jgi:hypothetical protein
LVETGATNYVRGEIGRVRVIADPVILYHDMKKKKIFFALKFSGHFTPLLQKRNNFP